MASTHEVPQPVGQSNENGFNSTDNHDSNGKSAAVDDYKEPTANTAVLAAIDDVATLPKGTVDPVYEAKARVLNKAVCRIPWKQGHMMVYSIEKCTNS